MQWLAHCCLRCDIPLSYYSVLDEFENRLHDETETDNFLQLPDATMERMVQAER